MSKLCEKFEFRRGPADGLRLVHPRDLEHSSDERQDTIHPSPESNSRELGMTNHYSTATYRIQDSHNHYQSNRHISISVYRPPPFIPTGPLPAPQQGRSLPINQKNESRSLSSYSSSGCSSPSLSSTSDSSYDDGRDSSRGRGSTRRSPRRKAPYLVPGTMSTVTAALPISRRSTHNAIERARRESLAMELSDLARMLPCLEDVKRPSKLVIVQAAIREIKELRERVSGLHLSGIASSSLDSTTACTIKMPAQHTKQTAPPLLQLVEDDDDNVSTTTSRSSTRATTASSCNPMTSPTLPDFEELDFHLPNATISDENVLYNTFTLIAPSPSALPYAGMDWAEPTKPKIKKEERETKPSANLQSSLLLQPLFDEHHSSAGHMLDIKDHGDLSLFAVDHNNARVAGGHYDVGGIEDLFMSA
ncbi:hypothetical protein SeMB42_g05547 [Synchytrium endobioticum]|uniref:BHLH domain-containing protein n=1 Tax=Synchytrium endobioticum TaxID=286115 RepID=A0A507CQS7_9FUNG|nr:hypothetical protein SeMB42_g05547 [Synchytrium endobioticum]